MRSLQSAFAALLVLLATGSVVALAAEPDGPPATQPAVAPAADEAFKFALIADAHICNWHVPVGGGCDSDSDRDSKRVRLENAVTTIYKRENAERIVSLGDAIEDLYVWYFEGIRNPVPPHIPYWLVPPHMNYKYRRASSRSYWKYATCDHCGRLPHYLIWGNHDIRSYWGTKYLGGTIRKEWADDTFKDGVKNYLTAHGQEGGLIRDYKWWEEAAGTTPWKLLVLDSGEDLKEGSHDIAGGSCVRFTQAQLGQIESFLKLDRVWAKHAILFWHVQPRDAILNKKCVPKECTDGDPGTICYLDLLRKYAHKIGAIFFGHGHNAQAYIWNTAQVDVDHPYGKLYDKTSASDPMPKYTGADEIMMFMVPSTGYPPKGWDQEKYPDLFFEVSLGADNSIAVLNWNRIPWKALDQEAVTPAVLGESRYTEADSCFEQDNDGDGWFDDDKVDCPGGTHMGTELDYDRQTYTIGAELRQSCKVRNYTPGEYYAVSSAETGETALERLTVSQRYGDCTMRTLPISELDPEPGGGGVAVVVTGPDGVARQIANARTRDYTDHASGITVDSVMQHPNSLTEAHLENVPEDYQVRLYVKFRSGLTGELLTEGASCDAETHIWLDPENLAHAEELALKVVDNNAPQAPALSQPPDGASSACDSIPSFAWDPVSEATAYQIQVDDDDAFISPEIDSQVSGTSFSPAAPLPAGSRQWRVRAAYDCGHGSWSPAWGFKQLDCVHLPVVMRQN